MDLQAEETERKLNTEYVFMGIRKHHQMQIRHANLKSEELEHRIKVLTAELDGASQRVIEAQERTAVLEEQLAEFIEFVTRYFEAEDHARMASAGDDLFEQVKAFDRLSVAETILRSRLEQYHFLKGGA